VGGCGRHRRRRLEPIRLIDSNGVPVDAVRAFLQELHSSESCKPAMTSGYDFQGGNARSPAGPDVHLAGSRYLVVKVAATGAVIARTTAPLIYIY